MCGHSPPFVRYVCDVLRRQNRARGKGPRTLLCLPRRSLEGSLERPLEGCMQDGCFVRCRSLGASPPIAKACQPKRFWWGRGGGNRLTARQTGLSTNTTINTTVRIYVLYIPVVFYVCLHFEGPATILLTVSYESYDSRMINVSRARSKVVTVGINNGAIELAKACASVPRHRSVARVLHVRM